MQVASGAQIDYGTVKTIDSASAFERAFCEGWDEKIWNIPATDGVLPTFR